MSSLLAHRRPVAESLTDDDRTEFAALLDADPLVTVAVAARLRHAGSLSAAAFGAQVFGVRDGAGRLTAALVHGGNLIPVGGGPAEWCALTDRLGRRPRGCTSVVGRDDAVRTIWRRLAPAWGPPRAVRHTQPLLVLARPGTSAPADPRVRPIRPGELDAYVEASCAMFTAELGISPYAISGVSGYRRRVAALIDEGRALGIVEPDGEVVFKADIGAVSGHTCQVLGVWVHPDRRRRGLGRAGMAAVLRHALTLAPTVSLHVNDFNLPARRLYRSLGMREAAVLSTVLL